MLTVNAPYPEHFFQSPYPEHNNYMSFFSGANRAWICGLIQYTSFYGICVAYTITTSTSIRSLSIERALKP